MATSGIKAQARDLGRWTRGLNYWCRRILSGSGDSISARQSPSALGVCFREDRVIVAYASFTAEPGPSDPRPIHGVLAEAPKAPKAPKTPDNGDIADVAAIADKGAKESSASQQGLNTGSHEQWTAADADAHHGVDFKVWDIPLANFAADHPGPSEAPFSLGQQSLGQYCKALIGLPEHLSLPDAWLGTDTAQGEQVELSEPFPRAKKLHFTVAQQLGQHVGQRQAIQQQTQTDVEPEHQAQSNWLDQVRPKPLPLFDYLLHFSELNLSSQSSASQSSAGKNPAKPVAVSAWLWWLPGHSGQGLLSKAQDLSVVGVTPDGVALYCALRERWRRSRCGLDPIQSAWALVEGGSNPGVWFFANHWFRQRQPLNSLADLHTLELGSQQAVVLWLAETDRFGLQPSQAAFYDPWLRPCSEPESPRPAEHGVLSMIAWGAALQGCRQRDGDWYDSAQPPQINLLPWRGARLQELRRQFIRHSAFLACGVLLMALAGGSVVQHRLDQEQAKLQALEATYQQSQKTRQRNEQLRVLSQRQSAALDQLSQYGGYGHWQLHNALALLALIPDCVEIQKIQLSDATVTLSGFAADQELLLGMPERVFAGMRGDSQRSIGSWPVLLTGTEVDPHLSASAAAGIFQLRVPFVRSLDGSSVQHAKQAFAGE